MQETIKTKTTVDDLKAWTAATLTRFRLLAKSHRGHHVGEGAGASWLAGRSHDAEDRMASDVLQREVN